ncbi:ATP-dependent Clp protease ATP-binding subunit ClpA homolog [Planktothrix tepida]|uniref:Putative Calcium/calmodulin-dependent protein kinase n=1 Tax=Planktothrix tepida PCC 9214 TaxID=671072 RepID=A0A1J1LTQ3_9CYAN|nr:serine/threonine-protein kinase [Planktothrix tepida]CAD5990454.1 ATP-dependent Clp protease ATP-binding subunit ClpA homolog [Planktothrix tepida]CUR35394.1 putative Calcium/calmodulin-dependent protein kinase [Planktothrix tepida PCC 9214]
MFERFNEKAIKAIILAQEEARRLGHNFVGTEQILLGLVAEGTDIAAKALKSMGVNLKNTRLEVEKIIGRGSGFVTSEIPFTPRAKRILEFSLEESRQLGHNYIGTEHLLLGLIREEEGVAVRVLENLKVNFSRIRKQVLLILNRSETPDTFNKPTEGRVFEHFTEKSIKAFMLAQEESRRMGHNFVGTEQILLGLIAEATGIAAKVLRDKGIKLKNVRIEVEKIIGRGSGFVAIEIPFTPRAKRVLKLSLEEAQQLQCFSIDTEHLLLGLLQEGEGVGARVLENLGLNLSKLRTQIIGTLGKTFQASDSSISSVALTSESYKKVDVPCPVCHFQNSASATSCASCGSPLTRNSTTLDALPPGSKLLAGAYTVGKVLGQGGFGITYLGSDTQLKSLVAIKEFFPQNCRRQGSTLTFAGTWTQVTFLDAKQRFLEEGRTLRQFSHPGIVRVFHAFEENNTVYLVMEYLRGKNLAALLEEGNERMSELEAVGCIQKICKALEVVHQANFLHRDIKPENIIVTEDRRIVLIDFGAAKQYISGKTQKHSTVMTPGYAPLEQYAQQAKRGTYTDIYALGATLYHLLTGEMPVSATDRAVGVELRSPEQLNPNVSQQVAQAVMQAMAMKISDRPQSVGEFLSLFSSEIDDVSNSLEQLDNLFRNLVSQYHPFAEYLGFKKSEEGFTVSYRGTGDVQYIQINKEGNIIDDTTMGTIRSLRMFVIGAALLGGVNQLWNNWE